MRTKIVPVDRPNPKPFVVHTGGKSVPVVDGAFLDIETHLIVPVKGFIKVNSKIALDPTEFKPFAIGEQFFLSMDEARHYMIRKYTDTAHEFLQKAEALKREMKK